MNIQTVQKSTAPKIGLRMIKSSLAVFLCFIIYLIRGEGIPFYSAIAAVLCMQQYISGSVKTAVNRTIGTVIGGVFGMVVLTLERKFMVGIPIIFEYLLISLAIIPLIYITVIIEKPSASYITCVVFMSVTVTHRGDTSAFVFGMSRIVDTLIGIFVSLGVNRFVFPLKEEG